MALAAGELRHRITIQRSAGQAQDPVSGEIITTWEDVAVAVPAKIVDLSMREFIAAQAVQSKLTSRITIRHRPGLDASMRIVCVCRCHEGRVFNPAGWLADPDSGLEYLTAPCSEGVNQG